MNKDFNYKVARTVGVPVFEKLLHPTIINKEYIPEEGPIILCGNHLHVWDQFPVICATKRVTHWMAKKEYFDSKLGPFFKMTGSICVDRDGDASKASEEALQYLNEGSAIGIFPEGTRNKLQVLKNRLLFLESKMESYSDDSEEYQRVAEKIDNILQDIDNYLNVLNSKGIQVDEQDILLPLHYGAVSMAKKSGALIVPFGVTGDYTRDNENLAVRFEKPFKVGEDIESSNMELHDKIVSLVKKNYAEFGRSTK